MQNKIVVVDDQQVLTSIYRAKFSAEGFHVDVASDGAQALEVIKRANPDVVLLDLMLPKINGIEVLKQLRANPAFGATPVVVFSNAAQPATIEDAWSAGATLVLSKSNTSPKQLVELVQRALASGKQSDHSKPQASEPSKAAPAVASGKILLVESNPESRALITHLLSNGGYQVTNAEGQDHALLLNEVTQVDLVLTNRALCKNGLRSFSDELRRQRPGLPLIVYSMNTSATEAEAGMRDGVSKFLITPEDLLNVAQTSAMLISESRAA